MPPSPIRTVLAAVDPGPGADGVVRSAALLAARTGAALHLVHVVESGGGWMGGGSGAATTRRAAAARRRMEDEAAGALGGAAAEIHVASGRAHREILARAEALDAGVLVVGANRSGALEAHFMGSSAERVVHGARCPVMVVKDELRLPVRGIGVPTDANDPAQGAVESAMRWSARLAEGGEAPPVRLVYAGWEVDRQDDAGVEDRVVIPALEAVAARAAEAAPAGEPAPRLSAEAAWGNDPAHDIARWAEREGIGLLVLATHGSGGLRRLLGGSVAQSIARQAPCPVLLLPASRWEGGDGAVSDGDESR